MWNNLDIVHFNFFHIETSSSLQYWSGANGILKLSGSETGTATVANMTQLSTINMISLLDRCKLDSWPVKHRRRNSDLTYASLTFSPEISPCIHIHPGVRRTQSPAGLDQLETLAYSSSVRTRNCRAPWMHFSLMWPIHLLSMYVPSPQYGKAFLVIKALFLPKTHYAWNFNILFLTTWRLFERKHTWNQKRKLLSGIAFKMNKSLEILLANDEI